MGNINRSNPTTIGSGVTVSDFVSNSSDSKGSLIGPSSYVFAGNGAGIAISQSVASGAQVVFNSPSLLNLGSVFPGQPVTLTITATAATATSLTIKGYKDHSNITETITVPSGTNTLVSINSYTNVNSITANGALTNVSVGTNPLTVTTTLGVKQPQLAASIDINSSKGAVLFPKASQAQIAGFDSQVNGITYASTDGMRVYNTTTNSFCEKVNGYWSGLYLEDAIKPTTKKISTYVDAAKLVAIGAATPAPMQILPALPTYAANTTGLGSSQTIATNKALTLNNNMPYPAKVTLNRATATGTPVFTVTGSYNGITFSETVSMPTTTAATTINKFSSVTSVVCTSAAGPSVSVGYSAASPVYVVYKAITQFNGGTGAGSGSGNLVLNFGSTYTSPASTGQSTAITLLLDTQLKVTTSCVTSSNVDAAALTSTILSFNSSPLMLMRDAEFVPSTSATAFVTIEYDIVW